jgi:MFS family permease
MVSHRTNWASGPVAKIVSTAGLIFACYLCIGLQLATVPVFVHFSLGFGATVAGLAVSVQYVATLASRPLAGRWGDRLGCRRTTVYGLLALVVSGLVIGSSALFRATPAVSVAVLMGGRLVLGFGESLAATGATVWSIGRVPARYVPQAIAWSGMASYGALAIGAPTGVWVAGHWGFGAIGLASAVLVAVAVLWAVATPDVAVHPGRAEPLGAVLWTVLPFGVVLALGGIGFGTVASFITLYYARYHWSNPGLLLSVFTGSFFVARLLLVGTITRFGGHRVAIVSLALESVGLVALVCAPTPALAIGGATLAAFGFALVFPSLGVEAVATIPQHSRGTALGIFTAFVDLSLGISGPIAGLLVDGFGYPSIFWFAAACAAVGTAVAARLHHRRNRVTAPETVVEVGSSALLA